MKKKVIFGVLDWGLGHAGRSICLIDSLLEREIEVVLASSGDALTMLRMQYPDLQFIELPSYRVRFSNGNSILAPVFFQLPHIQSVIWQEHRILEDYIRAHSVDGIISDNRYGLWTRKVPTVFMTHQVFLKLPAMVRFTEPLVNQIHHLYIKRFNTCWIPDYPDGETLSGALSHSGVVPFSHEFLGPLSRFDAVLESKSSFQYDAVAVLSGPEPQRTIFEEILLRQMALESGQFVLIRGLPGHPEMTTAEPNVDVFNYLNNKQLESVLSNAAVVICRSGYSSLMDLDALGKPGILVPTPGQSEQEYLAEYHSRNSRFITSSQKSFRLKSMLERVSALPGSKNRSAVDLRMKAIDGFIGKL